ncbi:MAG: GNAT family N-acetyltransferase [Candidatus Limnocylindrales bacterium]
MTGFQIRAMTGADVDAAVELALAQGWRDRRLFYDIVLRTPSCLPLVGTIDGRVVTTGLGVVSLPVGWIGAIVVAADERRRGFGRAMTEEICARLRAAGCATLSLEATDAGRPLYERMGFRLGTCYHQLQAGHLDDRPVPPQGARVRMLARPDLPAILELDRLATGEDRSAALEVLAESGGWVLMDEEGQSARLRGFLLPAERAYGAVIAARPEDGIYLLDLHRYLVPAGAHVRAGVPHENAAGWGKLEARGWRETWRAPRMLRGPDVAWRPEWIWGQINSAMG